MMLSYTVGELITSCHSLLRLMQKQKNKTKQTKKKKKNSPFNTTAQGAWSWFLRFGNYHQDISAIGGILQLGV